MTRAAAALIRRALAAAAIATAIQASAAWACADFAAAPSSRWSVRTQAGASWLVTPCGDRFYSLGVNVLDGGNGEHTKRGNAYAGYRWQAVAPTLAEWSAETASRLKRWGFNTAGGWSLPPQQLKLPAVINLELGRLARFHWFDPFSAETELRMNALARELVAPYRDLPYRIGYFSDNEVGWWAGALFVWYSKAPASSATKQRWVELVRRHYRDDWSKFAADFLPPAGIENWDALLGATRATRMKPGGEGIHVVREWTRLVAERYYTLSEQAIRAADPDALYFGDRLPIYYDAAAVRAMAPHVDAIATNYNVDSPDGWIADYYFDGLRRLSGGKPVLVSEWFFAARENRSGNRNNGHLMTVATQEERAAGAAAATLNFAAIPEVIGAHWFQYYDHPRGGRSDGEDYDFGLVDIADRPYESLTSALAIANRRALTVHARAPPSGEPRERSSRFRTRLSMSTTAAWRTGQSLPAFCRASDPRREPSNSAMPISHGTSAASRWQRSDRIISISISWPMTARSRSSTPTGSSSGSMPGPGRAVLRCSLFRRAPSCTTIRRWQHCFAPARRNMR